MSNNPQSSVLYSCISLLSINISLYTGPTQSLSVILLAKLNGQNISMYVACNNKVKKHYNNHIGPHSHSFTNDAPVNLKAGEM